MSNYALYSNSMSSGKTYYSKVWQKNGYTPISLATPLKTAVHHHLDEVGISYNPDDKETLLSNNISLRDWYIQYAKLTKANFGDDIFINQFLELVKNNPDKQYICDDVRTPEEYHALKEAGFVFIFVDRLLDTPDNEMEGLLFSDVYTHLTESDDFVIPNYYLDSPNYSQYVYRHIVEGRGIEYELLKKILLEGIKRVQDNSNPTSAYKVDIKFKHTKLIDRVVYISGQDKTEGEGRAFKLHNLKDVSTVTWYLKTIINSYTDAVVCVDNNLDAVVELIQMDNEEEE